MGNKDESDALIFLFSVHNADHFDIGWGDVNASLFPGLADGGGLGGFVSVHVTGDDAVLAVCVSGVEPAQEEGLVFSEEENVYIWDEFEFFFRNQDFSVPICSFGCESIPEVREVNAQSIRGYVAFGFTPGDVKTDEPVFGYFFSYAKAQTKACGGA